MRTSFLKKRSFKQARFNATTTTEGGEKVVVLSPGYNRWLYFLTGVGFVIIGTNIYDLYREYKQQKAEFKLKQTHPLELVFTELEKTTDQMFDELEKTTDHLDGVINQIDSITNSLESTIALLNKRFKTSKDDKKKE